MHKRLGCHRLIVAFSCNAKSCDSQCFSLFPFLSFSPVPLDALKGFACIFFVFRFKVHVNNTELTKMIFHTLSSHVF